MQTVIQTLFTEFQKTREFNKLAPRSKTIYIGLMRAAENEHFHMANKVSQITERRVDELYESLLKKGRHAHANMFMKVMRRIWSVMKRKGMVKSNPFREMGLESLKPRNTRWTKDQLDTYFDKLKELGYNEIYLLTKLCYILGQRPGDMAKLTQRNFSNNYSVVEFTTQKTDKRIHLPIFDEELKNELAQHFKVGKTITNSSSQDISVIHRSTLNAAGLPAHLQIRDLRRTALLEIFEAGGSDAEGQAISAHSNRSLNDMLNIYSPYSYQMAVAAMSKRFGLTEPKIDGK